MLAPVVLFVYNRPEHTRQTLEALAKNELAGESLLYIFADGPKAGSDESTLAKINEIRVLIREQQWCKEVNITESATNIGLADSVISGVTEIVNRHGKIIVLEDDIVTSVNFLSFMNDALEHYENFDQVAGVSGFAYPSISEIGKVHFLPIGCSWSWATWKRQWDTTEFDSIKLFNEIRQKSLSKEFDFGGYEFFNMLKAQADGKLSSWAIRFYASFFLQKKCFVYPPGSLVQNIGFDDTATHTKLKEDFFDHVTAIRSDYRFLDPVFDEDTQNVKTAFENKFIIDVPVQRRKVSSVIINLIRRANRKLKEKINKQVNG